MVIMMTKEGNKRDMKFTICDVSKAFGSVFQMFKIGHRVVFNPPWDHNGSYIEHVDSGENMWLEEKGGLYMLNAKVAPRHKQTGVIQNVSEQWSPSFPWQARP